MAALFETTADIANVAESLELDNGQQPQWSLSEKASILWRPIDKDIEVPASGPGSSICFWPAATGMLVVSSHG